MASALVAAWSRLVRAVEIASSKHSTLTWPAPFDHSSPLAKPGAAEPSASHFKTAQPRDAASGLHATGARPPPEKLTKPAHQNPETASSEALPSLFSFLALRILSPLLRARSRFFRPACQPHCAPV